MSILLDKQETNILRNGDNPQLERRVQPRKILSLPYILSCLPTRRCGLFVMCFHNRCALLIDGGFELKIKFRARRSSSSSRSLKKKGTTALFRSIRIPSESRLKRFEFAIDRFLGNESSVEVRRIREMVVKTFMKKEGKWVLCSPTTSSRSIFRVRTVNARNRYRFFE